MRDPTGEVTDLLQNLIRLACVNDGTADSGGEIRSADLLASYLEGSGLDLQRYEPHPGRGSLVARIEGSDAGAPSLALLGHLDVVPANPDRWRRDPFGGELVNGEVWGRGAVDMLNTTSSMAVAFRSLARAGFRPRGSLIFVACADEEALGTHGAQWLTQNAAGDVRTDYLITEFGGMRMPLGNPARPVLPVMVAEKGTYWCRLRVRGTPGHASMPFKTDNALIKAAEVVRRLGEFRTPAVMHEVWRGFVDRLEIPDEARATLLNPDAFDEMCENLPLGEGRMLHACTHTTFAPTVMHGGVKTNVIPDSVDLQVDVRTLPGQSAFEVRALLDEALGDLAGEVQIVEDSPSDASMSPQDTPLWDTLSRASAALVPGARTVPFLTVGATDARHFRAIGVKAYGYGLLSDRIPFSDFARMFHGDDERVDVESLRLSTELWLATARDFLG